MSPRTVASTVPSEQCTAKAKSTGERCRRLVVGGGVCPKHGGAAPQVKAKRLERVALAERFAATPHRHPGEVLLDAVHTADVLAKQAREELETTGATKQTIKALVEATHMAAALSRSALGAEAEAQSARFSQDQAKVVERALSEFMVQMGLSGRHVAERALQDAVRSVAGEDTPLRAAGQAREAQIAQEQIDGMRRVFEWMLEGLGIKGDPWVQAQLAVGFRRLSAADTASLGVPGVPPLSWWRTLRDRAEQHLPAPRAPLALEAGPARGADVLEGILTGGGPR